MPIEVAHVWGFFEDLSDTRTHGPGGLNGITFAEIDAYARRMRVDISPFETWLIREVDKVVLRALRAPPPPMPGLRDVVAPDDGPGTRALLRRLAKPKAATKKEGGKHE